MDKGVYQLNFVWYSVYGRTGCGIGYNGHKQLNRRGFLESKHCNYTHMTVDEEEISWMGSSSALYSIRSLTNMRIEYNANEHTLFFFINNNLFKFFLMNIPWVKYYFWVKGFNESCIFVNSLKRIVYSTETEVSAKEKGCKYYYYLPFK
jgi:hypothetical protein